MEVRICEECGKTTDKQTLVCDVCRGNVVNISLTESEYEGALVILDFFTWKANFKVKSKQ